MLMTRAEQAAIDIDVPIPPHLAHLGTSTRARIAGNRAGPLIVALGGISADRFVAAGRYRSMGWWPGLVGPGLAVDPERHLVLGLDFAADESGRIAPTTHDQAEILAAAIEAAGVGAPTSIIGASYGGMIALALAEARPELVDRLVIISAPAAPHPAATAIREIQRRIVALGLETGRGAEAQSIARGLAMTTYRTHEEFAERFAGGIPAADPLSISAPGAYLRARGDAYGEVMSPQRFLSLSGSIDRHRVDPSAIAARTLVLGASSDRLVPPEQSRELAAALPDAELHILDCLWGHDMFLKDAARLGALIGPFLEAE
ncbi:homoserine O-succinyltransferase [Sphingosinicella ginsenosidimutans]|uniref:Alpha/beta fold hydrolase n=1 Tax=Allosphingosinicella ginsenosidimutans TaxID=1176539 RepID=A0A5C6TYM7_9SPHN|nr:alpha/beta fold hydrolase [Sphingosinicella ginsenosidimutans]TXC64776.1 alpha/beta fold hydrolase [Sphingosinicella ginsenosidimutans]